jgi:hypothetical protein
VFSIEVDNGDTDDEGQRELASKPASEPVSQPDKSFIEMGEV